MDVNRELSDAFMADPQTTFLATVEVLRTVSDTAERLIEERTEARAEAFRAQERVRELEGLMSRVYAEEVGSQRPRSYLPAANAFWREAKLIATKRREGK